MEATAPEAQPKQSILTRTPLMALAVAAFGIGTSEFIIMGLLPNLADDFRVSIPRAGLLVTAYALAVTLGAPVVALATARLERKLALLLLMGVFTPVTWPARSRRATTCSSRRAC